MTLTLNIQSTYLGDSFNKCLKTAAQKKKRQNVRRADVKMLSAVKQHQSVPQLTCSGSSCVVPSWYTIVTTSALALAASSNTHSLSSCERQLASHTRGSEVRARVRLVVSEVLSWSLSLSGWIWSFPSEAERPCWAALERLEMISTLDSCLLCLLKGVIVCTGISSWFGVLLSGFRNCLVRLLSCAWWISCTLVSPLMLKVWLEHGSCDTVICDDRGGSRFPDCLAGRVTFCTHSTPELLWPTCDWTARKVCANKQMRKWERNRTELDLNSFKKQTWEIKHWRFVLK